jgi:hypothetical protein
MAKLGLATSADVERDPEMEGLMAEIEADLREEELRKIWQRYGKFIIAAAAAIVIAAIGVQLWRQHAADQQVALAARFDDGRKAIEANKPDDALAAFADVAKHSGQGYATIAALERAALLLKKNDIAGAVAIYKSVSDDAQADPTLRDLATLLQVLHSIDTAPPKTLEAQLTPLLNPGNPFNPSALELSAMLAAKQGDMARAAKLAEQIIADPAAPQGLRGRAEDLATYYKSQTAVPAAPPKS